MYMPLDGWHFARMRWKRGIQKRRRVLAVVFSVSVNTRRFSALSNTALVLDALKNCAKRRVLIFFSAPVELYHLHGTKDPGVFERASLIRLLAAS